MKIDMLIDKLTPCLEDSDGNIYKTVFSLATKKDLTGLSAKGWHFNWNDDDLRLTNIYKLLVDGDDTIQGLVSAEVGRGAVYVHLVESAPHNIGENKIYAGVGGHLFAIAAKLSDAMGFDGYLYFEAKNLELVEHYIKTLGANRVLTRFHEYRMELSEENAQRIIEKYELEGDLNVKRS